MVCGGYDQGIGTIGLVQNVGHHGHQVACKIWLLFQSSNQFVCKYLTQKNHILLLVFKITNVAYKNLLFCTPALMIIVFMCPEGRD